MNYVVFSALALAVLSPTPEQALVWLAVAVWRWGFE